MLARFTTALYNLFKLGPSKVLLNLKHCNLFTTKSQCTISSEIEHSVFYSQQFDGLKFIARLKPFHYSALVRYPADSAQTHLRYGSPLSLSNSLPLPKLSTSIFGRMISRSMATVRPFSHIERKFIENSKLLPSIVNSLGPFKIDLVSPLEKSSVVLTGLIQGDFLANNPREFVQKLEIYQQEIAEKVKSLKIFGERLCREDAEVSFAFVDGKIAVRSEQGLMENIVAPRIKTILPWSDGWKIVSDSPTKDPEPSSATFEEVFFHEKSDSIFSVISEKEELANQSLREQFPNLCPDELEAFTAWSDACS